jgi:hypothetical protein
MMVRPATSTPRPLPRKREASDKRPRLSLAGAVPAHASNDDVNSSGLAPAKAIQTIEAPLAWRRPIQMNEGQSDSRLATLARIEVLRGEIRKCDDVVCAWGSNAKPERAARVASIMRDAGARLWCLGTTKDGLPRHPLYVRADQPLIEWSTPQP